MFKQKKIRQFFERNGFAVSTRLAEVLGHEGKKCAFIFYLRLFYYLDWRFCNVFDSGILA